MLDTSGNPKGGKQLTRVSKRAPVDIDFKNLSYKIGQKDIIRSVSGKFPSGKLIGILGASGAGKTSLLNVLAGQIHNGVSGEILINDFPREMKKFHKLSSYIMQEDLLQPLLSVRESMDVAAKLKLGNERYSDYEKDIVINEVLTVIGLDSCLDTRVEDLSGGQRKRLSIALELVNNPPVMFLDEPTTGLDNVAMKNCVQILKSMANQGRTMICTIHQPSDSLFKLFDMVYFMSNGCCIYNGTVSNLVSFLDSVGFPCPITYSPADYIIELVQCDPTNTQKLSEAIENGSQSIEPRYLAKIEEFEEFEEDFETNTDFPNSFRTQFGILLNRMLLQLTRNKTGLILQFGHHVFCGLLLGIMFYQMGNSGDEFINNIKLFFGIVVYFMFTHIMSPILLYPNDVKILQREYFNRWYSLKAYFAALSIAMLPIMIITALVFLVIAYPMTGQPMEIDRIIWFVTISLLMAVTSQGFGYSIGSLFSPMIGACIGSALSIPLVLLGMYGVEQGEVPDMKIQLMMSISFPYHAFVGLSTSMLNDRGLIECEQVFCYFGDPQGVLRVMGMKGKNYQLEALILVFFLIFHRLVSYVCLRVRVTPDHFVMRYIRKLQ